MTEEINTDLYLEAEYHIASEKFQLSGGYYLHLILIEAFKAPHNALRSGNAKDGLLSLQVAADQAKNIALAIGKIKEKDLNEKIQAYKKELEEKNIDDTFIRKTKIANFQIQYILSKCHDLAPKSGEIII